jgi:hypothetical protein
VTPLKIVLAVPFGKVKIPLEMLIGVEFVISQDGGKIYGLLIKDNI